MRLDDKHYIAGIVLIAALSWAVANWDRKEPSVETKICPVVMAGERYVDAYWRLSRVLNRELSPEARQQITSRWGETVSPIWQQLSCVKGYRRR